MGWRCLLHAVPTGSGEPTLPERDGWKRGKSGGEGGGEKERHCALQSFTLHVCHAREKRSFQEGGEAAMSRRQLLLLKGSVGLQDYSIKVISTTDYSLRVIKLFL